MPADVQLVHVFKLQFDPNKPMRFESPWPEDFAALVGALRGLNE